VGDPENFHDDGYSKELATAAKLESYLSSCLGGLNPPASISCTVDYGSENMHIHCQVLLDDSVFVEAMILIESEIRLVKKDEDVACSKLSYEAIIPAITKHSAHEQQLFAIELQKSTSPIFSPNPTILPMQIAGNVDPNYGRPTAEILHVILLIHGIRDIGAWQSKVSRNLVQRGTVVEQIRYGYYPEVQFLLPFDFSRGPVQKVLKRIRAIKNHYPNAKMSVIAHSFGTYVFLKALERDTDLEFWKIIFCGSVADDQFEWSDLKRRVGDPQRATKDFVLNDCGTGDAWPVLGAAFGWHYGMAGATGFSEGFVTNRFHRATGGAKGGHGLYFDPDFVVNKWRPFLIDDAAPELGDGDQGEHLWGPVKLMYHGWMRIICRLFALMVWLLLITFLSALLYWTYIGGTALFHWVRTEFF
jgi:hypothetical protein